MFRLVKRNPNLAVGIIAAAIGCIVLFVWIPADVETGLIEKVRSQVSIGDSLAPSLAACIVILAGLILTAQSLIGRGEVNLTINNIKYLALLAISITISLNLIYWSGSFIVEIAQMLGLLEEDLNYRALRDTIPWKFTGYILGGVFMVCSLISFMEHKLSYKAIFIAIVAVLVLIVIYDVPFDNIVLPPNGDF